MLNLLSRKKEAEFSKILISAHFGLTALSAFRAHNGETPRAPNAPTSISGIPEGCMYTRGLLSAQFSPATAAAPSPPPATASVVAQAHWRRRPQNKSRAASSCLRQPACNRARAQQSLWCCKGLLSARRRCRTEPASSHSERRSPSPLAPPPAKKVPGDFSMLMATCMQPGKSTAVVMVVQGAAVGPPPLPHRARL